MGTTLSAKHNHIWGIVCLFIVITIFTQAGKAGVAVGGVVVTYSVISAIIFVVIAAVLLLIERTE